MACIKPSQQNSLSAPHKCKGGACITPTTCRDSSPILFHGKMQDSTLNPDLIIANGVHLVGFHETDIGICNRKGEWGRRKRRARVGASLTHTNSKDKINTAIKLQQKQDSSFCFGLVLLFFFPVWMLITVPYSRDNERVLLPSIFQTKTWKIHEQGRPWCWASVFLSNISALEVLGKVTQQYSSLKDACQLDLKGTGVL